VSAGMWGAPTRDALAPPPTHQVRVNHAGCTGQCGHGPMVMVYPEDVWYAGVTVERAQRIFDEHLVGNKPVEAFRYVAPPGDNKVPTEPA
jgi:(2Fe-2S) ferredoxin